MTFEKLYNEYETPVYKFIYSLVRNTADAEDISQNVWMNIHLKYHLYDSTKPFLNWAITIANNCTIDFFRKKETERRGFERYVEHLYNQTDEETHDGFEFHTGIPMKYRMIYMLRFASRLQLKEISEVMHLPMGTIQWMLSRKAGENNEYFNHSAGLS